MKPRINVLTLAANDLDKAAEFCPQGLGLPSEEMKTIRPFQRYRRTFVGSAMESGAWESGLRPIPIYESA